MRAVVVDLFCGIGGLSLGFKKEGFSVNLGIDSDESCEYAFETNINARFEARDIRRLAGAEVARAFRTGRTTYRVLIGCAPCAPFSLYTGRYRKAKRRDRHRKWELLREFARIVEATKPHVVSMENVPRLRRHRVFKQFVAGLKRRGYAVTYYHVRAHHYGVPQRRSRLVLFASKFGAIKILPPTHRSKPVTVRAAIGDLPRLKAGQSCPSDRLHVCRGLSKKNLERLRSTPKNGSWKDWPRALLLNCHRKSKGKSFRSVYGRMSWQSLAPVITTQCLGIGNGRFGHPEQHRAISIREAALLQTFPTGFRFVPARHPVHGNKLALHIGNAVPVRLGRIIARSIKRHLMSDVVRKAVAQRSRLRRSRRATRHAPRTG